MEMIRSPGIVGESRKEKDIKPESPSKDTGRRPDNERAQKTGFHLGNSLRFSAKELSWEWGDFKVLTQCATPQGLS